jgi:PhoD related phosphatase
MSSARLTVDDLTDHWTHTSHDHERTMLIRTFQEIAFNRRIRVTLVSGDVHCCGVGYLYDPSSPLDHKLMYQIITSAIVNVPPPGVVIKLLHNKDQLWVPPMNSGQSSKVQSDTKEEMMELFAKDVDGKDRGGLKKLLPRRNYAICKGGEGLSEIWEICVERGRGSETVKYGPIAIPRLV